MTLPGLMGHSARWFAEGCANAAPWLQDREVTDDGQQHLKIAI